MIPTDNTERIERFLREQMTQEEQDAFMRDLETDEDLRKEAQLTALLFNDLQERQEAHDAEIIEEVVAYKEEQIALEEAYYNISPPDTRSASSSDFETDSDSNIVKWIIWSVGIVAVFLIILGIDWHRRKTAYEQQQTYIALADKYIAQTPKVVFRGGNNEQEQELERLFTQVRTSSDMSAVIARLETIYQNMNSEYVYHVNGNDIRITWFLALAYLKDGQKEKATELLNVIIKDDKGTYLKKQAEELLKDIK